MNYFNFWYLDIQRDIIDIDEIPKINLKKNQPVLKFQMKANQNKQFELQNLSQSFTKRISRKKLKEDSKLIEKTTRDKPSGSNNFPSNKKIIHSSKDKQQKKDK